MTFVEFLDGLAKVQGQAHMKLSPGPYTLRVSDLDARAAGVLLKLDEALDDDATLRQGEEILIINAMKRMNVSEDWYTAEARIYLYAWWWLVFWAAQVREEVLV